jgi:starch synthase
MLPKSEVIQILTHSTVFVCPSVYEPMGIVNLEAMACETAVVATATGGIPEVVVDEVTGLLVPIEQVDDGTGKPIDIDKFVTDLGAAITALLDEPKRAAEMGRAGRRRAVEEFSWTRVAEQTMDVYHRTPGTR